jgi:hypothetical protein
MSAETTAKPAFELLDNGDVVQNKKGKATILANYEADAGYLEFVSEQADASFRAQITRAILEDSEGVTTGNRIASYGIKGREADEIRKNEPPKPKASRMLGDKTPEVVEWYFKWRPQEAYVRYGVKLKNGEPVTGHCKRKEQGLGENSTTGLIEMIDKHIEEKNGIIANRATHMTFLKQEIVGATSSDVDTDNE